MPCNPITVPSPSGGGTPNSGFGQPFIGPGTIIPLPSPFPEDLVDIFNKLQFLFPPGVLQPSLNRNFGKDIFDGIMKLLDQFMPFLMLYKFFLPILNLIICIIEVLCALMNPFSLIGALHRLFSQCIPAFLNLFPIFALILMIISLLLLLLALIEYIIEQILLLVEALLRNINALVIAFQTANSVGVIAIATKLAAMLCFFQNLFVLLAFFTAIIEIFKDILSMLFAIPPCQGGENSQCCSPQYCPEIVQNVYTNTTGTLQYLKEVGVSTTIPVQNGYFNVPVVSESWQLWDVDQTVNQAFWNIVQANDVIATGATSPVFFPTDASYSATTTPQQAAYTCNLRLYYNPIPWGRTGHPQYIRFTNCIVLYAPTQSLELYNNTKQYEPTGVFYLAGGQGFLDDGKTPLDGYAPDGVTPLVGTFATLENFLHMPASFSSNPVLSPSDGYTFSNATYTFTPNLPVLLQKNLITLGCEPAIAISRAFVNNVVFSNIAVQTADLTSLVKSPTFPDPGSTQQCLTNAVTILQGNMTTQGVADFQSATNACLGNLQTNTQSALIALMVIGFSPCNSTFTLTPSTQFTTLTIAVNVSINENNGLPMTNNLPSSVSQQLATQLQAYATFGTVSRFTYDGYQSFVAYISSIDPGTGSVMVSFNNQILCTNVLPDTNTTPSHTLQSLDYQFIYLPYGTGIPLTGEGDTVGDQPRRDGGS
jgi:hypothetical protein